MRGAFLYRAGQRILYPFGKLCFRLRVQGKENIPATGRFLLCCNHQSVLDPVLLGVCCTRKIRFMAKSELFELHGKFAAWLLRTLGAFPVVRDSGDVSAVRQAVEILREEEGVGIFPQGGCVRDGSPFRAKAGVVLIARKADAPVIPAAICCGGRIRLFRRTTVCFGTPLTVEELGLRRHGSREAATKLIEDRVNLLLEENQWK